jgi:hypothetical protein
MDTDRTAESEVLMAQIEVAEQPGRAEPWVFGLSRAGELYEYDSKYRGWRRLKKRVPEMVFTQIAVAERPGGEKPAVFGVTEAGNTMTYDFTQEAWWPLERRVLDAELHPPPTVVITRSISRRKER